MCGIVGYAGQIDTARGKQPPLPVKTEGEPKDKVDKLNYATFSGLTA